MYWYKYISITCCTFTIFPLLRLSMQKHVVDVFVSDVSHLLGSMKIVSPVCPTNSQGRAHKASECKAEKRD